MLPKRRLFHYLLSLLCIIGITNTKAQKQEKLPPVISKTNTALYNFGVRVSDMDLTNYYAIDKKIMDDFFKSITSSLSSTNGMTLKPLKFLASYIDYDQYGYPVSRGKKAVATNTADNYMNISVSVSGAGMKAPANESNPNDCVLSEKVAVRLEITVFDKAGEKIFDETATAKSKDKVDFHYSKFSIGKLNGTKPQPADTKLLYELLAQAIEEMSSQKFPK
ncbi:MAG: hypothetical protein IPP32_05480 [Bacteroidetes bacterium]|nr:hypothetical protein [Bacteroidota bacterium]